MSFGKILKQCLEDSNASIRKFSEITEINRGWIYNIFNGKKSLSEEKFQNALEQYPFTDFQKKQLREAYYKEMYGPIRFHKIKFILESLKSFSEIDDSTHIFPEYQNTYTTQTSFISTSKNTLDAIVYLLSNIQRTGRTYIYTNFLYEHTEIDNLVYSYILSNQNIDLFHFISMDHEDNSTHNLNNIMSSLKYISYKFIPFYYYEQSSLINKLDTLFPYFFITKSGCLLYDETLENSILLQETDIIDGILKKVKAIFHTASPLATIFDDILDLNHFLLSNKFYDNKVISIGSEACVSYYLDTEIIENVVSDGPKKDYISYVIGTSDVIAENGLEDFFLQSLHGFDHIFRDAVTWYYPKELIKDFSIDIRIKLLKKIIHNFNTKHNIKIYDVNHFSFPEKFTIEVNQSKTFIGMFLKNDKSSYIGHGSIVLDDAKISHNFKDSVDYILRNKFVLSDKYVDYYFNTLLFELEQQKK